eukprot:1786239-Rhodomonas_salina.1
MADNNGWPKDWFVVVEKLDRLATGATSTTWATATFQAMEEIYNVDDCFSSDLEDGKRVSELCKETLGVETDEEEHWWETWDWRWEAFFHEWLVICPYVLPLSLILDLISSSRRSFEELTHPLSGLQEQDELTRTLAARCDKGPTFDMYLAMFRAEQHRNTAEIYADSDALSVQLQESPEAWEGQSDPKSRSETFVSLNAARFSVRTGVCALDFRVTALVCMAQVSRRVDEALAMLPFQIPVDEVPVIPEVEFHVSPELQKLRRKQINEARNRLEKTKHLTRDHDMRESEAALFRATLADAKAK